MLHAAIGVQLGDFRLDIALDVGDGEVVALLGPNGAGKTTALRAIAGLQPLDDGRIELDGTLLDDPDELVPEHAAERVVAALELEVGAADAGAQHPHQRFSARRHRHRHVVAQRELPVLEPERAHRGGL